MPTSRPAAHTTSFGLVVLAAAIAHAGDPPQRIDPRVPEQWRTGEIVTVTTSETSETRRTRGVPAVCDVSATRFEARFVVRCLDAAADGQLLRALVRIECWSIAGAGRVDRCLEGALVETGPAGWKLVAAGCNPSRTARAWLDSRLASGSGGLCWCLSDLGANRAVAAGDSWTSAAPQIPRRLAASESPVPLADAPWRFTVAEIASSSGDPTARVGFDETLPVRASPSPAAFADGGTVRVRGSLTASPGLAHLTASVQIESQCEFTTSAAGGEAAVAIRGEQFETWCAGGVAPEAIAAEPGTGSPCSIGAAEVWNPGDACVETGTEHVVVVATPVNAYGRDGTPERGEWTVSWTSELECDDSDADGRPRVLTVRLREWAAVRGKERDESVRNAVLRVSRTGLGIVRGGGTASDLAKAWLRTHFGGGGGRDDPIRDATTPEMPIAARQSWRIDPDAAASALRARFEFPFDPATLQGTATLGGIDGNARASVEYAIDARIAPLACSDVASVEAMTGTVHVAGEAAGPVGCWSRFGALHDTTQAVVPVPAKGKGEDFRRLSMTEERDIARSPLAPRTQSARTWTHAAIVRAGRGDADGAVADCTRAIGADPECAAAWCERAHVSAEKGDLARAIADYSRAIDLDPGDATSVTNRGAVRDEQGDLDGAVGDWTRAVALDPSEARAHLHLARALFRPGLPAKSAADEVRKAIAADGRQDYAHLWLWLVRAASGDDEEATAELTSYATSRTRPRGDDWYSVLAALLAGTVTEDAALAAARTGDAKSSDGRLCEFAFYAGMRRAIRGDVPAAIALLDESLGTRARAYTEFIEAARWRRALLLGATTRSARAADGRESRAIVSPDPHGPAARAGLLDGDVVVAIDGVPLAAGTLDRLLVETRPGTVIRLGAMRDGGPLDAAVTLGVWSAR